MTSNQIINTAKILNDNGYTMKCYCGLTGDRITLAEAIRRFIVEFEVITDDGTYIGATLVDRQTGIQAATTGANIALHCGNRENGYSLIRRNGNRLAPMTIAEVMRDLEYIKDGHTLVSNWLTAQHVYVYS